MSGDPKMLDEDQVVLPTERHLPPDISTPRFGNLVDLALLRVYDAAFPLGNRPPRLFPAAETVFSHYYTRRDWANHGDLETEKGRMSYLLSNFPERGIPSVCTPVMRRVLLAPKVLVAWGEILPQLKESAMQETQWIVCQMRMNQSPTSPLGLEKSDFVTIPVDYRVEPTSSTYATRLWARSLQEITASVVSHSLRGNARAFLEVFAFLKDPLGGLDSTSVKAVDLFVAMVTSFSVGARKSGEKHLVKAGWYAAIAQAAQEALFLACPLLDDTTYIHFTGHQQLTYVYVPLDNLHRSEFSIAQHVLHIASEILASEVSEVGGYCAIAPIAVSCYPRIPKDSGPDMTVIIDGNHRASAVMVLRLIAEYPSVLLARDQNPALDEFCLHHGLEMKWKVDLRDVLELLYSTPSHKERIEDKMDVVMRFKGVQLIPALVVREDHFHTACQQRPPSDDRPRLLLPIHQFIFNDEKLGFAFPQAGQVHGRALGFKPMPLIRGPG